MVKQLKEGHRRLQMDPGKDSNSTFFKPASRTTSEERKPLRDMSSSSPQKYTYGSGSGGFLGILCLAGALAATQQTLAWVEIVCFSKMIRSIGKRAIAILILRRR